MSLKSKLSKVGIFSEDGFSSGTSDDVLIQGKAGFFIASKKNDFVFKEPFFVRAKSHLILAIGGMPETETEKLAKELNVSKVCALDILYLRSRHRWTQELEEVLIGLDKEGIHPKMSDFGCTEETAANLFWETMNRARETS